MEEKNASIIEVSNFTLSKTKEKEKNDYMKPEKFNEIVDVQFKKCRDVLVQKADEYARGDDRFENLRGISRNRDVTLIDAVFEAGLSKHMTSLFDFSRKGASLDRWEEKITDSINYLCILSAILEEGLQTEKL